MFYKIARYFLLFLVFLTSLFIDCSPTYCREYNPANSYIGEDWIFYPNQLINEKPLLTKLNNGSPIKYGAWYSQNKLSKKWHYGVYHKSFSVKKGEKMALGLNLVYASYRVWLNDRVIFENGHPDSTEAGTRHSLGTAVVDFVSEKDTAHLFIEVADFKTQIGGIIRPIVVGPALDVIRWHFRRLIADVASIAVLLTLSLYNILIWFYEKRSKAYLFFGLFTLMVVIRGISTGSLVLCLLFPEINPVVIAHLKLISFFVGFGLASYYFHFTLNRLFKNNLHVWVLLFSVLFSLFYITINPFYGFYLTVLFEVMAILASVYCFIRIADRIRQKDYLAWYPLVGLTFFTIFFIYDMLISIRLVNGDYMIHYGTLAISLAQTFYLGKRHQQVLLKLSNIEKDNLEFALLNRSHFSEKERIISDLNTLKASIKGDANFVLLDRLLQKVRMNDFLDNERKVILNNSRELNNEFFQKLQKLYPQLTQGEREFLSLVKLKLDTKGIAIAKGVSPGSVKVFRNRIRRKLNLPKGFNLIDLVEEI